MGSARRRRATRRAARPHALALTAAAAVVAVAAGGARADSVSATYVGTGINYGLILMGRVGVADFKNDGTMSTSSSLITGLQNEAVFSHTEGGVFPAPGYANHTNVGLLNGGKLTTSGDPEFWTNIAAGTGSTLDTDFRSTSGSTNPLLGPGTGLTPQGEITYQTGTAPAGPLRAWESTGNIDPALAQARADVLGAYNAGVQLATTAAFAGITSLTGNTTLMGVVGVNVLNLTSGINLGNGEIVYFNGPAGAKFIINVSSQFKFQSGGIRIAAGSGINPWDIIYNITDDLKMTSSGGGGGISVPALPPAYITGLVIMPHPDSEIALAPGAILGNLYFGGKRADFPSGGRIAAVVPLPTALHGGAGLLLGAIAARTVPRRRHRRTESVL
jgi:hypothetical protein